MPVDIATKEEQFHRIRVEDPGLFEQSSFRTIVFSKSKGIKAVVGRKTGKATTSLQSLLFDKSKFSPEQAKAEAEKIKQGRRVR